MVCLLDCYADEYDSSACRLPGFIWQQVMEVGSSAIDILYKKCLYLTVRIWRVFVVDSRTYKRLGTYVTCPWYICFILLYVFSKV